ncbi:MAG: exo-alpha-sialidase [Planctomycetota bacterium]|jgi:hypothetical protein
MNPTVELQTIQSGYDRETCWVQTRAGILPNRKKAVITTQKLRLSGSDIFYDIHSLVSNDQGKSWSSPQKQPAFAPRSFGEDGAYFYVSDFWPRFHNATGVLLGTGHTPLYKDDELLPYTYPRTPAYSTFDPTTNQWRPWYFLTLPDEPHFYNCGAGCTQRVDLPSGEILLPIYCVSGGDNRTPFTTRAGVTVARCAFDGEALTYLEHGDLLQLNVARGFVEPSLAMQGDRFFLTLRNDEKGYMAMSRDGLHFETPQPWRFDNGEEIGNYNTQQHWVNLGERLYLVYTRRGLGNNHVFRHRAPLVMAEVDVERGCLLRDTEQPVIPQRGARLGNFGITEVSDSEVWVVASEWMQGPKGTWEGLEEHGSENAIFIARVTL